MTLLKLIPYGFIFIIDSLSILKRSNTIDKSITLLGNKELNTVLGLSEFIRALKRFKL